MATVREFDGAGDRIVFSPGVLEVVGGAVPVTVMALVKLDTDGWRTIVSFEDGTQSEVVGIQVSDDDEVLTLVDPFGFDQFTSSGFAPPDEWLLVGMHRPAGANQQIRAHAYRLNSETWAHEDTATRSDPGAIGAGGRLQIGEMSDFGEFLAGRLAVVGVWLDTFSDQELEGAGLHAALVNWLNLGGGPASLLAFNQESENTPVVDVVAGSGVTQTSIVGTTVVDDQDLAFDFDLDNGDHVTTAVPLVLDLGFVAPAAAAALLASAEPLALTTSIGTPEVTAAVSTTATPLALAIGGGDPETAADLRSGAAPLMLTVGLGPVHTGELRTTAAPLMLTVSAGRPATNVALRSNAAPLMLAVSASPPATDVALRSTAAPLMLTVSLGPVHTGQPPELLPRMVWAVPAETRTTAVRGETRRVHVRA